MPEAGYFTKPFKMKIVTGLDIIFKTWFYLKGKFINLDSDLYKSMLFCLKVERP